MQLPGAAFKTENGQISENFVEDNAGKDRLSDQPWTPATIGTLASLSQMKAAMLFWLLDD
jgi:hypothetical protein